MKKSTRVLLGSLMAVSASGAWAACSDISYEQLKSAVEQAVGAGKATGGYGLNMWATVVDETGKVCWVTTSGVSGITAGNNEWLGSRVISAQKANTANAFSLDGYAISTANLYSAVQGEVGSLYGLQFSNPVNPSVAYAGSPAQYGTKSDPLKGKRIGGVNVFGGGLALYAAGKKVGALGVSGDTSCRDHAFAWRVRDALGMKALGTGITTVNLNAAGVAQTPLKYAVAATPLQGDEMILGNPNDTAANYWNAWAQPLCPNSIPAIAIPLNGTLSTLAN